MPAVFVCHRGSDAVRAEELATELRAAGHEVWLDEWRIDIGDSVVGRMNEGLEDAAYLVLCYSADDPPRMFMTRTRVAPRVRRKLYPSPAQHRLLGEGLQQPILSEGARLSLYHLAGSVRIEAIIPLARATLTSSQSALRAGSIEVLGSFYDLPSLPVIAALVRDPDASVRATAARAIGRCRDRGEFPALAAALEDHAPEVRAAACDALGQSHHPDSGEMLARRIVDAEPVVRASAINALREIRDRSAAAQVATLLSDPDASVRAAAAGALGDLGGTEHVDALLGLLNDKESRYRAARSVCRLADRDQLRHVLDLLAEGGSAADEATSALVRLMGAEAAPTLLKHLEIADLCHEAVIQLTTLIAPENPETRAAMLHAAAASGPDAVDALTKWLKPADAELLGELATVVRHADEPSPMLAVASSGAAGHPDVLAAARDRLDENDIEIRGAVAAIQCAAGLEDGLEILTGLLPRFERYYQWMIASALSNLESPPPEVVSVLLSLAASDDPLTRVDTARSLGRLDRPDATAAFLRLLDDPEPWVRREAVRGLKGSRTVQGEKSITDALLRRLEDRSFDVRIKVVEVLGEASKAIAVAPLLDTLANDISGEVRRVVPDALAKHGIDDTTAAALHYAADEDPDPLVREAARKVLDGDAQDDG